MVDVKVIVVAGPVALDESSSKSETLPESTLSPEAILSPGEESAPKAGNSTVDTISPGDDSAAEAGNSIVDTISSGDDSAPKAGNSTVDTITPVAECAPKVENSTVDTISLVAETVPKSDPLPQAGSSSEVDSVHVQESGSTLKRSPSNRTLHLDFDTIAVLNVWTRHQKLGLGRLNVFFTALLLFAMHMLELVTFVMVLVGLWFLGNSKGLEIICTVSVSLITYIIAIIVKIAFQRNFNSQRNFCSCEAGGIWKAFFLLTNPFKHLRAIYHRRNKLTVLEKEFIHGETVTCDQFEHILGINRDELIDARDDLHDAFIRRLPMALVQFYFFYQTYNSKETCNIINGIRFLNVLLNIMFTIPTSLLFEWKQKLFLDSLHVHSYLVTGGRYQIPPWTDDHVCNLLRIICLVTYILSRFFLVGFSSGISLGSGILSFLILLISNWVITAVFPSVVGNIENLPVGVNIPVSYVLNRWMNAFSWSSTLFNDLSTVRLYFLAKKARFPWVITQVLNFLLAYLIVYFFVDISSKSELILSNGYLHSLNATFNLDVCTDAKQWPNFVQYVSSIMYSVVVWLSVVCYRTKFGLHSIFHLHWSLFFVHLIFTIVYNIYSSVVFGKHGKEEYFPPMITFRIFKYIFRDIFNSSSRSKQSYLAARFMFLIALDLKSFTKLYESHSRNDAYYVNTNKWWEEQIMEMVERNDPLQSRYRGPDNTPDLTNLPIEEELHRAYISITHLPYSFRLFLLCGHRFDDSLMTEITSNRLEATIDMLQLKRERVLQAVDESIMYLNSEEVA